MTFLDTWTNVTYADGRDGSIAPRKLHPQDANKRTIFCPTCGIPDEQTDADGYMTGPLYRSASTANRAVKDHEACYHA